MWVAMFVIDDEPFATVLFEMDTNPTRNGSCVLPTLGSDKHVHANRCAFWVYGFPEFDPVDFLDLDRFEFDGFELGFQGSEFFARFGMNRLYDFLEAIGL